MRKQTAITKQQNLQAFAVMNDIKIQTGQFASRRGIALGIVETFRNLQLQQGRAIGSVNGRLSTVRMSAKIALNAVRQLGYTCVLASVMG